MTDNTVTLSVMREDDPQVSFADLEFMWQGVALDPLLQQISEFIDEHPELTDTIGCDLERGLKRPETGRNGLSPNQVLRSPLISETDYREVSSKAIEVKKCSQRSSKKLRSDAQNRPARR